MLDVRSLVRYDLATSEVVPHDTPTALCSLTEAAWNAPMWSAHGKSLDTLAANPAVEVATGGGSRSDQRDGRSVGESESVSIGLDSVTIADGSPWRRRGSNRGAA